MFTLENPQNNFEPIEIVGVPEENEPKARTTAEKLRDGCDKVISLFCSEFIVDGKEKITSVLEKDPSAKLILAASHLSNLDAPAAVKALGDEIDIQITFESVLLKSLPHNIMFGAAGKESFSPLKYAKEKGGKHGVFDPKDFDKLSEDIQNGKTPWMAVHPFTKKEKMQATKIGSVYLSHKTGAKIVPTALEFESGSMSLDGPGEIAKGLLSRAGGKGKATYHIGKPIDLPNIDVGIIDLVFQKRITGKRVTQEEKKRFKEVHELLKEQADQVAGIIASMLPEEQRGSATK